MSKRAGRSVGRSSRKLTFGGALALLASVALAASSAVLAQAGAAPGQENGIGLERAIAVQEANTDDLLTLPGVNGTAVTVENGEAVVVILVERSGVAGLPRSLDGVSTVVRNIGQVRALAPPACGGPPSLRPPECNEPSVDRTARFDRPVPIGVSTGHPDITAGTIGARVKKGNNVYALSNNHVYADENQASTGDQVIQPGSYDGGTAPADTIGTLDDYQAIVFSTSASNVMDAAIALSSETMLGNATPPGGYGVPQSTPLAATVGLDVIKYGRTTGLTSGSVAAINAEVRVGYGSGSAMFVNQIIVTPGTFSAGGDSGSLVVSAGTHRPVGLLFAGSSQATIINPIQPILDRFGVTIDDSPGTTPPPAGDLTVTSLDPDAVSAGYSDNATIQGGGFVTGAAVSFVNGSGPTPSATNVSVSADGTTITFTLAVKAGGPSGTRTWDVRVTNPGGASATLVGGLTVTR